MDGQISFKDSYREDITEKFIKNFAETTKIFTNWGFAQLLIKKDMIGKDKFELYSEAYKNDLVNREFKTLFYVDSKTKKCNLIDLGDTAQGIKKDIKNGTIEEVDILYLLDATGSMRPEINSANEKVIDIFNYLKKKYNEKDFNFGVVFYRDLAYALHKHPHDYNHNDNSGIFKLTGNMN